jgi:hypothetical protein
MLRERITNALDAASEDACALGSACLPCIAGASTPVTTHLRRLAPRTRVSCHCIV